MLGLFSPNLVLIYIHVLCVIRFPFVPYRKRILILDLLTSIGDV